MKSQLIENLKSLLAVADVSTVKQEMKNIKTDFQILIADEKQIQMNLWKGQEHEDGEDFEYIVSEEEKIFNDLFKIYEERLKENCNKRSEEQINNLTQKKDLLVQLYAIVHNEKNIGKSFQHFNSLTEKWQLIGDIPKDQYQIINNQYQRLREVFFYNITIYKELQEYDLKVNLKRKEDLIQRVKALKELQSIKECEYLLIQIQKEWNETGPSPKETYQEIGDVFYSAVRDMNTVIRKYYSGINTEMKKTLVQKNELLNEAKNLIETGIANHSEWIKKTDALISLQEKWKAISFVKNKEHDDVWKEFRKICDLFFERKKQFYVVRNEECHNNKKKKTELIEKVNEVKESMDWEETTGYLLTIQKEWKNIGGTFQEDEHRLWHSFRVACDTFFIRKKEHFQKLNKEQKTEPMKNVPNGLERKEAGILIKKIDGLRKQISQYENNMGFFSRSSGSEILKMEVKKKVNAAEMEIQEIEKQLQLLN